MTANTSPVQSDPVSAETPDAGWSWLQRLSSAAAFLAAGLLLAALIVTLVLPPPGPVGGWLAQFQDLWLIVIFKLHAGLIAIHPDPLQGLNWLDLTILLLVGILYAGLATVLRRAGRFWPFVAAVLPFLGIGLFMATQLAGRSSVMGAGIIISLVMLRSRVFSRVTALTGIVANSLLLIGDVGLTIARSNGLAALTAIGYLLLIAWFISTSRSLFWVSAPHLPK